MQHKFQLMYPKSNLHYTKQPPNHSGTVHMTQQHVHHRAAASEAEAGCLHQRHQDPDLPKMKCEVQTQTEISHLTVVGVI